MIARKEIQTYCDAIARQFKPEKIIHFGSYAYGTPTKDSDVDLMVVIAPTRSCGVRMSLKIRQRLDSTFPMDLLVRTPAEIRKRLSWRDCFIEEIVSKGQVMYEASHRRMGRESRGRHSSRNARHAKAPEPKIAP